MHISNSRKKETKECFGVLVKIVSKLMCLLANAFSCGYDPLCIDYFFHHLFSKNVTVSIIINVIQFETH